MIPTSDFLSPLAYNYPDTFTSYLLWNDLFLAVKGQCVPFYPEDVKPITEPPSNDLDPKVELGASEDIDVQSDIDDLVDGRPAWYDPIITETFMELKLKFEERFFNP